MSGIIHFSKTMHQKYVGLTQNSTKSFLLEFGDTEGYNKLSFILVIDYSRFLLREGESKTKSKVQ